MRIYQYVMIAKMVLADKPTNKESESESVFFSFTFFVFFWRKFTFCAQGTVLMLELRYLAYIILEFFSKGDIFSIFEF